MRRLLPFLGVLVLALVLGSARASSLPVISGFSPADGAVGAAVTVTGSGFSGATAVTFNGTAASFTVVDDAEIQTSVPFGATKGKIGVRTPAGSASSATAFGVQPTVSGFSPAWGLPGTVVTITGSVFTGAAAVSLGGVDAAFTADSYTQISATVPAGAATGTIRVRTRGLTGKSTTRFRVLVPGPAWPQFRYDHPHSGSNPNETILSPGNVSALQLDWSKQSGDRVFSSPAIAKGIVYVGSLDGRLYAFDAATDATLWSVNTGRPIYSSPAIAKGVVYVGSEDQMLHALDAVTGATLWSARTGDFVESSPAVANGIVYVGSDDGIYATLYAFDAATGATLWTARTSGYDGVESHSSPAVSDGIVYLGSLDGNLYAFNAATGASLWTATTGNRIESSPAVANGVVYVGSYDDRLYAFDAMTGATRWSAPTGAIVFSSPAVANGIVYVGSEDGNLYAFDAATGAKRWSATTGNRIDSSPAVANGVVYVGSTDDKLHAFDAVTGAALWNASTGGLVGSSPAVANGIVYVGSFDNRLYAYHLPAGTSTHN